jgi:hypothetical protein
MAAKMASDVQRQPRPWSSGRRVDRRC